MHKVIVQTPPAYFSEDSVLSSLVCATEYDKLKFLKGFWEKYGLITSENTDKSIVKMESQGLQY